MNRTDISRRTFLGRAGLGIGSMALCELLRQSAFAAGTKDAKVPILVEVRFPQMGTSSDSHLFEEAAELAELLQKLAAATEVHISSVWDLQNVKGETSCIDFAVEA